MSRFYGSLCSINTLPTSASSVELKKKT